MKRRAFLYGLGAASLAGFVWRWLGTRAGPVEPSSDVAESPRPAEQPRPAEEPTETAASTSVRIDTEDAFFSMEDHETLLAFANVIVPPYEGRPGAGEIDLVPRLESLIHASQEHLEFYEAGWPILKAALTKMGFRPGPMGFEKLNRRLIRWGRIFRRRGGRHRKKAIMYSEQLRRDVLLAYYSSPEGWASLGYEGPVHLSQPPGGHQA